VLAGTHRPSISFDVLCDAMYSVSHGEGRYMVKTSNTPTAKFDTELRRGAVVLAVLSQLRKSQYGYSLRQALAERGMPIEEGTLYPLMRRLEEQGLLVSEWRIEEGPPRRYYKLSPKGTRAYAELTETWQALVTTMNKLLD
jgi:PadR family transcriptional regulator PadR